MEARLVRSDPTLAQRLERAEARGNAERQGFRIAYTRIKWHLTRS